jgi:hypothetical protein
MGLGLAYCAGLVLLGAQAGWRAADTDSVCAAASVPVPGHTRGDNVRLSASNAPVTMASPTTAATAGHIGLRRCRCCRSRGRAVTRSVKGIASWPVSLVKIANSGPRPGWSSASVFSIWSRARCWLAGKLIGCG